MPDSRTIDHTSFEIRKSLAGTPSMWDGYKFGVPGTYFSYFDDFLFFDVQHWIKHDITHAGTAALTDAIGGQLLLTNAAADDDGTVLQLGTVNAATGESFIPTAGKRIFFEIRFQIAAAGVTQGDVIAGLCLADTTPMANTGSIAFCKDDGDTNLDFRVMNTTLAGEAVVTTIAAATWYKLGFKVTGTSHVEYWMNDVRIGELAVTLPTSEMKLTFGIQNGEAAATTMTVDYVFIAQER